MADAPLTPQQQIAILAEALAASRSALGEVRRALHAENEKPGGAIRDTIWRSGAETLFDYIDAALDGATPSPPVAAVPATPEYPPMPAPRVLDRYQLYRRVVEVEGYIADDLRAYLDAARAAQPQPQPAQPLTGAAELARYTLDEIHQALLDIGTFNDREREDVLAILGKAPGITASITPTPAPGDKP